MRPTLERTLALQQGIGIQAEIVDPADLARIEPRIDTSGLGAVLWEPGSGYGDPSAVTAGFAAAARRRGAVIEQGVEVIAIRRQADRVVGVDTATGRADRRAGRDQRGGPLVTARRAAGRRGAAHRDRASSGLHGGAGRRLRARAHRLPGPGRRQLRAARDRRPHPDRVAHRRRDPAPDGPGAPRQRGRLRRGRGRPGPHRPGHPRAGRRAVQPRLRGGLRHHAGLDADSRRVPGARLLDRGGHVRSRLQAVAGGGRDDGRPRHGRPLAGEPDAVPARSLRATPPAAGTFVSSYLGTSSPS